VKPFDWTAAPEGISEAVRLDMARAANVVNDNANWWKRSEHQRNLRWLI
jgi:hypothetical protein